MRLLLLNQYGANSGAPTGRILAELGSELESHGHTVKLITSDSTYGKPRRGLGRILHEGLSHLQLLTRGLFCAKVDGVISLTSPACLAVTAGIVARRHGAKHFHWVMDLYPEAGVRLGELPDGFIARLLGKLMHRAYARAFKVIVLDEDMREFLQGNYGVDSVIIAPPPPEISWPTLIQNGKSTGQWLYSGNFGRSHEIQILLEIQKLLEDEEVPARLVLQGQGPQFQASRLAADRLGLRQVEWRDPVPLEKLGESLLHSDVVVVTRKAEMKGLLLPSKLILAELSGKPILWIGDTDGRTARRLSGESRYGVFARDDLTAIAHWLQKLFSQTEFLPVVAPMPSQVIRQQSISDWISLF